MKKETEVDLLKYIVNKSGTFVKVTCTQLLMCLMAILMEAFKDEAFLQSSADVSLDDICKSINSITDAHII